MKEVRRGVFLGDALDAAAAVAMSFSSSAAVITHLLSLLCLSPAEEEAAAAAAAANGSILRLHLPWHDTPDQSILDDLELCLDFIQQARDQGGGVLVHCLAGVSRSATVVTAYLMRLEQLTLEDALSSLRIVSENVCPNAGFLRQLKLFEKMEFKVDGASKIYKRFLVEKLGKAYDQGKKIENSAFAVDPALTTSLTSPTFTRSAVIPLYRCKKCRRIIACRDNVLSHDEDSKNSPFKKKERDVAWNQKDEMECTSIFVEPMQWMSTVEEGGVMGKLCCVACKARLGNFSWSGIQCSCGVWVVPAFQIHKSRIDASML